MNDLGNLVWHRLWLSKVTDIKYTPKDMVDSFYGIYTEKQIKQEIIKQEKTNDCIR